MFTENVAKRGAMFIIRNTVGIQGNTVFSRNVGPALRVNKLVNLLLE